MTQELKDEALEYVTSEVMFGFNNKEGIYDRVRDVFYNEGGVDEDWLKQQIEAAYNARREESKGWAKPTDFDKLAAAFDNLCKQKIIALHWAGYTKQDGQDDCIEVYETLETKGIIAEGYCFYHEQDMGRAIDAAISNLFIGFDSIDGNNEKAKNVGNAVIAELKKHELNVAWNGDINERIEIQNIRWQKVPDDKVWGMQRAVDIMLKHKPAAKPWWKLW